MADLSSRQNSTTMLVFDSSEWVAAGYDQPDGNERFWRPARILETINGSGLLPDGSREQIATVEWLHNGRRSAGHFIHMMRDVEEAGPLAPN